jgi:diguanylate cyclase (GGDEF)-like protein
VRYFVTATIEDSDAHADELRLRARSSGRLIAVAALFLLPAWSGFDHLLEPSHERVFLLVRLGCDVPIGVLVWLLMRRPIGRRRPELLALLVLVVVQGEVAWMMVRATNAWNLYLLGFTLPVFASGCVMAGRARWTAGVVAVTWGAFGLAMVTAPASAQWAAKDVVAACFFLITASIIGLLGHTQRDRLSARERAARGRLEQEQDRTTALLVRLDHLSHEDPLTGLANRRRWDAALDAACTTARENGSALAVLLIDVDRFKTINDSHGHAGGDEALCEVAGLLTRRVRSYDVVARIGGDEFGILLVNSDAVGAVRIAEQLRQDAHRLECAAGGELSLSLGVAAATAGYAVPRHLMKRADEQLYRAKATRDAVAV